jgi:hypothetical protein
MSSGEAAVASARVIEAASTGSTTTQRHAAPKSSFSPQAMLPDKEWKADLEGRSKM